MKENLYLIELWNDKERFYKIGVTVHRFCRFYQIMKVGYRAKIIFMIMGIDPFEAYKAEQILHSSFESYSPQIKFGGHRECFVNIEMEFYKAYALYLISGYKKIVENIEISWR